MTEDQFIILQDKIAVWSTANAVGPMQLRDYNLRARDALTVALVERAALLRALKALIPTNINLDHPGLKDNVTVPCDVTLGELRAARDAVSLAERMAGASA